MSIAKRIMLLIVGPAAALVGLAAWIIADRWETCARMQRVLAGGQVIEAVTGLVASLQIERGRSAQFLSSNGTQYGAQLADQRQKTDAALSLFTAVADQQNVSRLGDRLIRAIGVASDTLKTFGSLRAGVSDQTIPASESMKRYWAMIAQLLDISLVIIRESDHSDVKNHTLALSFLQAAGEKAGIERATGAASLGNGFSIAQLNQLASLAEEQGEFVKLFEVYAPDDVRSAFDAGFQSAGVVEVDRHLKVILATAPGEKVSGVDPGAWFKSLSARIDFYKSVQDQLLNRITTESGAVLGSAEGQLIVAAAITVLLIVLLGGLGIMTVRSITLPISAMVATMTRLAAGDNDVEVPAVGRKDEIGRMAEAVLTFKQAAIDKQRLELAAVEQRRRADEERAAREAQKAEEIRQDQTAIDALGDGLSRLANCDLLHCIETPFAPKTEKLRQDFNASVQTLRATMATTPPIPRAFAPARMKSRLRETTWPDAPKARRQAWRKPPNLSMRLPRL
jgi:methyl-accepting chemotaxis protein